MANENLKQSLLDKLAKVNKIFVVYLMCIFVNQFAFGMNMNIIGASMVDLRFIYNTSVDVISYGPNLIYMGYVLGSLVGWLYKWINRQLTISIALMFVGLLVVLAPHCGTIAVFFAILIFNGIGVGIWDSSSSIWLVEMWPNGNSPLLQTSQAMYGLGAILAPLLASPFLHGEVHSTDTNDRNLTAMTTTVGPLDIDTVTPHDRIISLTLPFLIIGIAQFSAPALMFILFFTNRYKKINPNNNDNDIFTEKNERSSSISSESFYKPKSKILDVRDIKYRFLKLTLVILSVSFCQAVEGNYFFFSSSMFQYLDIKMSASEAAKVMSILSTSFCVSRVMAALVSIKVRPDIIVFCHYFIILTATAILIIGQNSRLWIYVGTVAMGTGFAAMFSGIMAFTERHLRLTNQICSIFAFTAGLMAMVTPFVLSNLVDFHAHPIVLLFLTGGFITASLIMFIGASVLIWAI